MYILASDFFENDDKYIFKARNSKQIRRLFIFLYHKFCTPYPFQFVLASREY